MWTGAAVALAVLALASAVAGLFGGAIAALITFIAGGLLMHGYHLRNVQRLVEWTRAPVGTPIPPARGTWNLVFADLNRRSRLSYEMREQLASSLERFRDASQAMPDGILYLSADDRIEWMNHKAEQHFGLEAGRDCGLPVTKLVRQPDFVRFMHDGGQAASLVLHSDRRAGLTLMIQIVPFGDGQRMVVSRDISQLERLDTMRRDFVANVSHELRTPLTVVIGFLETLVDGLEEFRPDEVKHYVRLALDQSLRMETLIEDLLTLAALESGASAGEQRVAVSPLVLDIAEDARLLSAGRHEVSLDIAVGDGDVVVLGSAKELRSAFANLASNAVRYTPAGGTIRLSWRRVDGGAEFAVEDNGIGIEPRHIPRLTERFYRADLGRSRESGGTGLGLAIVKHILSRHDAELHVESEYGKGSRFSARFPAARLAQPPVQS
ncbi:phosphate regulon sensor histidine kinase PhoR [Aromatoleum sp.]|uniref:phosphate regulon sensor histidine kinase PhoR n=1 Tax=Aromatoleum sp. TaxID=2307007 RepID=UPI003917303A